MHPTPSGIKNGDGYDWGDIAVDLSRMMNLANEKVKEGRLLDAAEIARYEMPGDRSVASEFNNGVILHIPN